MIFHGVSGKDEREASSPSFFNIAEASLVKSYVQDLFDDRRLRLSTYIVMSTAVLLIDFCARSFRTYWYHFTIPRTSLQDSKYIASKRKGHQGGKRGGIPGTRTSRHHHLDCPFQLGLCVL